MKKFILAAFVVAALCGNSVLAITLSQGKPASKTTTTSVKKTTPSKTKTTSTSVHKKHVKTTE